MISYENRAALMLGLAGLVADQLRKVIAARRHATLAVPGGTTPAPFMKALSLAALDWDKVTVIPGDERFVPENSDRSNSRLIRQNLLQNHAAAANFLPLSSDAETPEAALPDLIARIVPALPIDVLIVGMGEDMHTASLFPDSPDLHAALTSDAPLAIIRAENAGEPRFTLSANALATARHQHVLFTGVGKLAALERARNSNSIADAPIRVVLDEADIHYAE